jgi:hypothetical protein
VIRWAEGVREHGFLPRLEICPGVLEIDTTLLPFESKARPRTWTSQAARTRVVSPAGLCSYPRDRIVGKPSLPIKGVGFARWSGLREDEGTRQVDDPGEVT